MNTHTPHSTRRSPRPMGVLGGLALLPLALGCGDRTGTTGGATGTSAGSTGAASVGSTGEMGSTGEGTSTSGGTSAGSSGGSSGGPACDPGAVAGMFCFSPVEPHALVAGDRPMTAAAADLDQDGRLDLATADIVTRNVSLLRGAEAGAFWPPTVLKVDTLEQNQALGGPSNLRIGDFDGDGTPDLLVSSYRTLPATSGILLFRNLGGLSFADFEEYPTPQPIFAIEAGDVDGNGDLDFLAARDTSTADVYLNDGTGAFTTGAPLAMTGSSLASSLALADLDGDGDLDAVAAQKDLPQIYMGNGDGTFGAGASHPQGVSAYNLHLVDVSGDGKLDMIGAGASDPAGVVEVSLGNGDGTFAEPAAFAPGFADTEENYALNVAVGDFNRDGALDLAVTRILSAAAPGDDGVVILEGAGDGTFTPGPTYDGGGGPYSMVVGDFTGDGEDDLVTVAIGDNTVRVLAYDPCACDPGA